MRNGQLGKEQSYEDGAGGEWDEEQRKSANREYGMPVKERSQRRVPGWICFGCCWRGALAEIKNNYNQPRKGPQHLGTKQPGEGPVDLFCIKIRRVGELWEEEWKMVKHTPGRAAARKAKRGTSVGEMAGWRDEEKGNMKKTKG